MNDLETSTFAEDHVALVHADVFEGDVPVTVRSVVKADDRKHSVDGDTWSVGRYEDDRLLSVDVLVGWVGFGHDNVDLAATVTGTT